MGTVTTKQPPGSKRATSLAELRISDEKHEPTHYKHHAVHLLPEYRLLLPTTIGEDAHATLFDEIADSFAECGITVLETPQKGVPSVIMICPGVFDRPEVVQGLLRILPANPGGTEPLSRVSQAQLTAAVL